MKRGLYRSKDGHLVNADCNGAANIGRKSKQNGFTGLSRGCLAQPLRIKIHAGSRFLRIPVYARAGSVKSLTEQDGKTVSTTFVWSS